MRRQPSVTREKFRRQKYLPVATYLKILEFAMVMEVKMTEVNRPDVIAGRKLTDTFDIDAMNYHDIQMVMHDFIKNVLLSSPCIHNQIPDTLIKLAENTCRKILLNLSNALSNDELKKERIRVWKIYDSQTSSHERNFTQLILGGLSDEEQFTDALENYATVSDILLPTFFNVYKLCGEELCKKYLEFLLNHPILKKYRVEHV